MGKSRKKHNKKVNCVWFRKRCNTRGRGLNLGEDMSPPIGEGEGSKAKGKNSVYGGAVQLVSK